MTLICAWHIDRRDCQWYRVCVIRGGATTISLLSLSTAERLLPRLLDRWGVPAERRAGLFRGVPIVA